VSGGFKQAFSVCGGCAVCCDQDAPTAVANAATWPGAEVAAALAAPAAAFAPAQGLAAVGTTPPRLPIGHGGSFRPRLRQLIAERQSLCGACRNIASSVLHVQQLNKRLSGRAKAS